MKKCEAFFFERMILKKKRMHALEMNVKSHKKQDSFA